MKKKIAVLFMAMSVVLGCTACGEDGSITCVEVEGINKTAIFFFICKPPSQKALLNIIA